MDKIIIDRLRLHTIIGIHEWERITPQPLVITVTAYINDRDSYAQDEISACLDYSVLAIEIQNSAVQAKRHTIEALAEDIAQLCITKNRVLEVMVRIDKIKALPNADSASIEIKRKKNNSI